MTTAAATTISTFPTSSPAKMQDPLSRVPGVGNVQVFGSQYAMRIWLDPYKLHNFKPDAVGCERGAGAERPGLGRPDRRPAGSVAGPAAERHRHRPVALQTPEQFRNIILKTDPSAGSWCGWAMSPASSWARRTYSIASLFNGIPPPAPPSAGAGRQCAQDRGCGQGQGRPLRASLPPGMKLVYPDRQHHLHPPVDP
jgi:multidrug efflux pump